MIIGIDINDTITHSSSLIRSYAKKHLVNQGDITVSQILNVPKIEGDLLDYYYKFLPNMIGK